MKIIKLFLAIAFVTISMVCNSQIFTANEFVDLSYSSREQFLDVLENKGYTFNSVEKNQMSQNEVYLGNNNTMSVSVISPYFEDGQVMISWEFTGRGDLYENLKKQFLTSGFKLFAREVRNGGRYISLTYQIPGVSVTLSCDKIDNKEGIYKLSTRYANPAVYEFMRKYK